MPNYRVTFIENEIATCKKCVETEQQLLLEGKKYHIEHRAGRMLFALVKAQNTGEAKKISKQLIKEISNKKKK